MSFVQRAHGRHEPEPCSSDSRGAAQPSHFRGCANQFHDLGSRAGSGKFWATLTSKKWMLLPKSCGARWKSGTLASSPERCVDGPICVTQTLDPIGKLNFCTMSCHWP